MTLYWVFYTKKTTESWIRFKNIFLFSEFKHIKTAPDSAGRSLVYQIWTLNPFLSSKANKFLHTQEVVERLQYPRGVDRTKYVAIARNTIALNIHFIHKGLRRTKEYFPDEKEGLLFHYRDWCVDDYCLDKRRMIDMTATKFAPEIWKRVDAVCRDIFKDGICPNWLKFLFVWLWSIKIFKLENFY